MVRKILVLFFPGLLCLASKLSAQWNFDPDINTQITSGVNTNNSNPAMTNDGAGGYYLVWMKTHFSGVYGSDIYAQHLDKAGKKLWADTGIIICNAPSNQFWPKIIPDNSGGAIIAWQDQRLSFSNWDIYAQRVTSSGNLLWANNGIPVADSFYNEAEPEMISDGNGGAIIAFWKQTNGTDDIFAQRINPSGVSVWTANGVPVCTAVNRQAVPKIASDGNGGAIITWWDFRNSPTNNVSDIYSQRIRADGSIAWAKDGVAICVQPYDQMEVQVATVPGGGAYYIWQDGRTSTSTTFITHIYAQKIALDGSVLWQENGIPVCAPINHQFDPNLIVNEDSSISMVWFDFSGTTFYSLVVQKMNQAGSFLWQPAGVLVSTTLANSPNGGVAPFLAGDGNNGLFVTWQDGRSGTDRNIYAQHILPDGKNNWQPGGIAICTAPQDQILSYDNGQIMNGAVISDNNGGVALAWQDLRKNSEQDIYAAWLTDDSLSSPVVLNVSDKCRTDSNAKGKLANPPSNASVIITQDSSSLNYSPVDSSFQYFTELTTEGKHSIVIRYSNFAGSKQKDTSYSITPLLLPTATITGDTIVSSGNSVVLTSVTTNSGTHPVYQWQEDTSGTWKNIVGATKSTLLYTPLQTGNKVRLLFIGSGTCVSKNTIASPSLRFTVNQNTILNPKPKYYLNPAQKVLGIDSLNGEWQTLNMLTIDGKLIFSKNISGMNKIIVNLQAFAGTAYILILRKTNGETYIFKV